MYFFIMHLSKNIGKPQNLVRKINQLMKYFSNNPVKNFSTIVTFQYISCMDFSNIL